MEDASALGEMPEAEESTDSSLFNEYADDLMAAMKGGDKAAFRAALRKAIECC